MRFRRSSGRRFRTSRLNVMPFAASAVLMSLGFIISIPFLYSTFVLNMAYHYMTWDVILMLIGFVIGAPACLFGFVGVIRGGDLSGKSGSMVESDISRIRFEVERQAHERKLH